MLGQRTPSDSDTDSSQVEEATESGSIRMTVGVEDYMWKGLNRAAKRSRETNSQLVRTALLKYLARPIDFQYIQVREAMAQAATQGVAGFIELDELNQLVAPQEGRRGPVPRFSHRVGFVASRSLRDQIDLRADQEQVGYATLIRRAIDFELAEGILSRVLTDPATSRLDAVPDSSGGAAVHETIARSPRRS